MSNRAPIQVAEAIKSRMDEFRSKHFLTARSASDVLERLMDYYEQNEREKDRERQRQAERMIDLGAEEKQVLANFRMGMGFRTDAAAIEFLLGHYKSTDAVSKETLALYRDLLKR